MTVRADMLNGHAICHGGFIFTLADSAFAFACNSYNLNTVAAGCTIEFLAPAREGDVLTATGRERAHAGGRTGVYDIEVTQPARRDHRAVPRQERADQGPRRREARRARIAEGAQKRCHRSATPGRTGADRAREPRRAARAAARRACTGRSSTRTTTCRITGARSTRKGVHPRDLDDARGPRAAFRSPSRPTCATTIRSACSPCRASRSSRIHASSGTTGKPTVVGYTRQRHRHVGDRDGALDPRRRRARRRHPARRLRLRPFHRRPRRALRRGEARLHGDSDVRRADREAGAAHHGLQAVA